MAKFTDDDQGYLRWIMENPDGFVVNVEHGERPDYAVLHRSSCSLISRRREDGAYTARGYKKVASADISKLREYVKSIGRADGSFSKQCGRCQPT